MLSGWSFLSFSCRAPSLLSLLLGGGPGSVGCSRVLLAKDVFHSMHNGQICTVRNITKNIGACNWRKSSAKKDHYIKRKAERDRKKTRESTWLQPANFSTGALLRRQKRAGWRKETATGKRKRKHAPFWTGLCILLGPNLEGILSMCIFLFPLLVLFACCIRMPLHLAVKAEGEFTRIFGATHHRVVWGEGGSISQEKTRILKLVYFSSQSSGSDISCT
jgi:hypothetical protein